MLLYYFKKYFISMGNYSWKYDLINLMEENSNNLKIERNDKKIKIKIILCTGPV